MIFGCLGNSKIQHPIYADSNGIYICLTSELDKLNPVLVNCCHVISYLTCPVIVVLRVSLAYRSCARLWAEVWPPRSLPCLRWSALLDSIHRPLFGCLQSSKSGLSPWKLMGSVLAWQQSETLHAWILHAQYSPFFPGSGPLLFLTCLASWMHFFKCVMDQDCKIPSVSMGAICNPCAVQVTSKLTLVYLEVGHWTVLLMLWIFLLLLWVFFIWLVGFFSSRLLLT